MMFSRWIGALLFVGVVAFAVKLTYRSPKSEQMTFASESTQTDLSAEIRNFTELVTGPKFTPQTCPKVLGETYQSVFGVSPTLFDSAAAKTKGVGLVKELFLAKLALRNRLKEFVDRKEVTPECIAAVRDVFRAGRVLEDVVGEWALKFPSYNKDKPEPVLAGQEPYLLMNPEFNKLEFKSGDVILSRGTAFTSAAIARIADADANFSHLSILHIDERTGEMNTVEAHIEVGSIVQSMNAYKTDGKVRAVLFRYPDARVAHEAATFILNKVRETARVTKENIPYDFAMDITTKDTLFCSELVSYAYSEVTRHQLEIPLFLSTLTMKNRAFLNKLGVFTNVTFAPADIEADTRFDLVAEWRDFTRMNENHIQDAVLTAMYDWMERENYKLFESPKAALAKIFAWHVRRWPIFGNLLKEKLPKNMSKDVIGTVSTLNEVGDALYKALEKANLERRKKTGFWLTPREMLVVLDDFRKRDLEVYKKYVADTANSHNDSRVTPVSPAFHLLFRPAK